MKQTIVAALGALAIIPAAHAQVLASGQIYGGPSQDVASCYLFNTGGKAVTLSTLSLILGSGTVLGGSTTTCTASLAGGHGCRVSASNLPTNLSTACAMQPVKYQTLRASLEIRDGNGNIMVTQPLR